MRGTFRARRLLVVATLAAGLLVPVGAIAGTVCPPDFVIGGAPVEGSPSWMDRNGDGLQCTKNVSNARILHFVNIDNNVPDDAAQGVTDTGSPVLIDTDTGAVQP